MQGVVEDQNKYAQDQKAMEQLGNVEKMLHPTIRKCLLKRLIDLLPLPHEIVKVLHDLDPLPLSLPFLPIFRTARRKLIEDYCDGDSHVNKIFDDGAQPVHQLHSNPGGQAHREVPRSRNMVQPNSEGETAYRVYGSEHLGVWCSEVAVCFGRSKMIGSMKENEREQN